MNDLVRCPVCLNRFDNGEKFQGDRRNGGFRVKCGVCGDFDVSEEAIEDYLESKVEHRLTPLRRARLSHLVRQDQRPGEDFQTLRSELIERVIRDEIRSPTPAKQALNLIRYIGELVSESGVPVRVLPKHTYAVIGSPNHDAVVDLADELVSAGLLKGNVARSMSQSSVIDVQPTLSGWERYEAEAAGTISIGPAIIAMQFNDPELDRIVDTVVKPAIREAGYELERVSDRPRAGVIDHIMRVKIRDAPFVLADLSHGNKGAYWEAGFAEGLGKPVIYLCHEEKWKNGEGRHFDTDHCETVHWHPDKIEEFRERLIAVVRNSLVGKTKA